MKHGWRRLGRAWVAVLCAGIALASGAQPTPTSAGHLPASFEGDLPGADGTIRWHLDLLPGGSYQLRRTYLDKPQPNRHDEIGRWQADPAPSGRIVLRGGSEPPLFLERAEGGALRTLDREGRRIVSPNSYLLQPLAGFVPIEPRVRLGGMFTTLADAPSIVLCADGRRLPVAMEGDYRALESAYLALRLEPGRALLATVEATIASRPSAEESQPPRPTLIVERFAGVWPRETCGQPLMTRPLLDTYWRLVRLQGRPVEAAPNQLEPHLIFAGDPRRMSGSGGCNSLFGSFEVDAPRLELSRVATTRMACADGMEQEQRFVHALEGVRGYRIDGSHLELLDARGVALARLEAAAAPR